MQARTLAALSAFLVLCAAHTALALDPFFAPAEPSGTVQVQLCPTEVVAAGSTHLVTFGFPFPRGSVRPGDLANVRILQNGAEVPAFVEMMTPWRHLYDASIDGASVRVARIQVWYTFAAGYPSSESVTVEWGLHPRTQSLPSLTDPRSAWHTVTSGTFVAEDGAAEPDVYAALPKSQLCKGVLKPGRMQPTDDSVGETRDDPAVMEATTNWAGTLALDHAQKNNFYTLINQDDPRVAQANLCAYKNVGEYEPWLYDRASAMFVLYFRSGFATALREGVRHAEFYRQHLSATGFFTLKGEDDEKYSYNECLAYERWLTGDDAPLAQVDLVVSAFNDVTTRWDPSLNFWTERHCAFKLLAQTVSYELLGGQDRAGALLTTMGDLIWLQNGAGGQIPQSRVDGGLYHFGSQHDWDWDPNTLGASPWMTVLVVDAAVREYGVGESSDTAGFLRRIGTFEHSSLRVSNEDDYDNAPQPVTMPVYAMVYNGTYGQTDWADVEHSLDVASALAWAGYFADLTGGSGTQARTDASALYSTYSYGVNYWIRPDAPLSGLSAFRVAPWRKYGWEHRPSGSFAWLMRQTAPLPALTSPAPGSVLPSSVARFQWRAGAGATRYWLTVGSSLGALDLFSRDEGTNLADTVSRLPVDGRRLYVRLWYFSGGAWRYSDATYTGARLAPRITSPTPGSTLASSRVTFTWSGGASQYWLCIGSRPAMANLFSRNEGSSLSDTVGPLPTDGRTLYVRLWYLSGGRWQYSDCTFTAMRR